MTHSTKSKEEIDKIIENAMQFAENCEVDLNDKIHWLKSIKERMKGK